MLTTDVQLCRKGFDLQVAMAWEGRLLGVTGPSGCGKTTWLHILAGLIRPDRGSVTLHGVELFNQCHGRCVPPHRRRVAIVFQDDRLLPHRSVRGNLLYGYNRTPAACRQTHPEQVIDSLDLAPLLHRQVTGLSGGEKRRVALARALLTSPQLLLLDEPTNGLDEAMCDRVLDLLTRTLAACSIPAIVVSHRLDHLLRLTDELMLMHAGRVVARGPASRCLMQGATLSSGWAEAPNRLDLVVCGHHERSGITELLPRNGQSLTHPLRAPLNLALEPGDPAVALMAPSQIVLARAPVETVSMQNRMRGRLVQMVDQGASVLCVIDTGMPMTVRITAQARKEFDLQPEMDVWCLFKSSAVRVYAGDLNQTVARPLPQFMCEAARSGAAPACRSPATTGTVSATPL